MSGAWDYIEVEPIETKADLLLVAWPSYGNVGPSAARILIDEGGLPLVGVFHHDDLAPAATSWNGVVAGALQVWGAPMRSGPEGRGGGLLLLNADIPIAPELMMGFARAVVDWAKAREVALVVTLEGERRDDTNTSTAALSCAGNLPAEAIAKTLAAEPRQGGLVGLAPAFLVHGNRAGLPVVALYAPADEADGDARAAMHVLGSLAPLVPALAVTTQDVEAKASSVVQRVAGEQANHQRELRWLHEMTIQGYV